MASGTGRLDVFDVLKGLCMAYIVAFWHMLEYVPETGWAYTGFSSRFTVGVLATFVFVSGYLAGLKGAIPWGRPTFIYYVNRFRRVYVPFFIALAIFYISGLCGGRVTVQAAALVSMFVPPGPPTLWFITMIMVYYMVVPGLLAVRDGLAAYVALVAALMATPLGLYLLGATIDPRVLIYFPAFALGCYFAANQRIDKLPLWLVSLAAFLGYGLSSINSNQPTFDLQSMCWAAIFPIFLVRLFGVLVEFFPAAVLGFIKKLAEASFFMYLLHRPIYSFAQQFMSAMGLEKGWVLWAYLLIIFPLVYLVSKQLNHAYGRYVDPLIGRLMGVSR